MPYFLPTDFSHYLARVGVWKLKYAADRQTLKCDCHTLTQLDSGEIPELVLTKSL
jgi:hypothetical protein